LNDYKIVNVPNKTFYIKRDVFYNGDREKVKLLIEKLRDFHNKGYEFSRIEFSMELRKGRALGFIHQNMDRDLRWYLEYLNPYNPDFSLPNLLSFNNDRFRSTNSPTPPPLLSKYGTVPYNPIKDKMNIINTINLADMEEQENQERLNKQNQERLNEQNQREEQIRENDNLIEQNKNND
jgi:hypothetical protein